MFEQLEKGLLAPLDIVEDHDHGSVLFEQLAESPGDLLRRCPHRALSDQRADRDSRSWVGRERIEPFDHFDHRPERDPLPVGKTATLDDVGVDGSESLRDEPRLAYPGLPDDRHELAAFIGQPALPGRLDQRQLALTPYEARLVPALRRLLYGKQPVRLDPERLPFQLERLHLLNLNRVAHER